MRYPESCFTVRSPIDWIKIHHSINVRNSVTLWRNIVLICVGETREKTSAGWRDF